MNYRISVKHRFDTSVIMNEQVYPFAPAKKLYQVGVEYVKASCDGEQILSTWEGQKDNKFYMIDNPQQEKISVENNESILPYDKIEFALMRTYTDPHAACMPLGDIDVLILGYKGNKRTIIQVIDSPSSSNTDGTDSFVNYVSLGGAYKRYLGGIFYEIIDSNNAFAALLYSSRTLSRLSLYVSCNYQVVDFSSL